MCTALEELKKEGVQEGLQKGLQEGLQKGEVKGIIQTCKLFNPDQDAALKSYRWIIFFVTGNSSCLY